MSLDEPTTWALVAAPDEHPHDLWAIGADLEPGTLLTAYRLGLFPMRVDDVGLGWWSPMERGIVELTAFAPSRSLRRAAGRYEIRIDSAFGAVIGGCADPARPAGWIDDEFRVAYTRMHELGWAHSVEAWDDEGLAGGLYGLAIGGLFAAESMFHRRTDASKAAFVGLVELLQALQDADARLLDVQWVTPHLERLGATTMQRATYRMRLERALELDSPF